MSDEETSPGAIPLAGSPQSAGSGTGALTQRDAEEAPADLPPSLSLAAPETGPAPTPTPAAEESRPAGGISLALAAPETGPAPSPTPAAEESQPAGGISLALAEVEPEPVSARRSAPAGASTPHVTPRAGTPQASAATPAAEAAEVEAAPPTTEQVRSLLAATRQGDAVAAGVVGNLAYALHTAEPSDLDTLVLLVEAQHAVGSYEYAAVVARGLIPQARGVSDLDVALRALRDGGTFDESWAAARDALRAHPGDARLLAHGVALTAGVPRWQPECQEMLAQVLNRRGELSARAACEVHLGAATLALAVEDTAGASTHLDTARRLDPSAHGISGVETALEQTRAQITARGGVLPEQGASDTGASDPGAADTGASTSAPAGSAGPLAGEGGAPPAAAVLPLPVPLPVPLPTPGAALPLPVPVPTPAGAPVLPLPVPVPTPAPQHSGATSAGEHGALADAPAGAGGQGGWAQSGLATQSPHMPGSQPPAPGGRPPSSQPVGAGGWPAGPGGAPPAHPGWSPPGGGEEVDVPRAAWHLAGAWCALGAISVLATIAVVAQLPGALGSDFGAAVSEAIGRRIVPLAIWVLVTVLVIREILQGRTFARVFGMTGYLFVALAGVAGLVLGLRAPLPGAAQAVVLGLAGAQLLAGAHGFVTLAMLWTRLRRREQWMAAPGNLLRLAAVGTVLIAVSTATVTGLGDTLSAQRGPNTSGESTPQPQAQPGPQRDLAEILLEPADIGSLNGAPVPGGAEQEARLVAEASRCAGLDPAAGASGLAQLGLGIDRESSYVLSYAHHLTAEEGVAELARTTDLRYAQCYAQLQAPGLAGEGTQVISSSAALLPATAERVGFRAAYQIRTPAGETVALTTHNVQLRRVLPDESVAVVGLIRVAPAGDPAAADADLQRLLTALSAKPLPLS